MIDHRHVIFVLAVVTVLIRGSNRCGEFYYFYYLFILFCILKTVSMRYKCSVIPVKPHWLVSRFKFVLFKTARLYVENKTCPLYMFVLVSIANFISNVACRKKEIIHLWASSIKNYRFSSDKKKNYDKISHLDVVLNSNFNVTQPNSQQNRAYWASIRNQKIIHIHVHCIHDCVC